MVEHITKEAVTRKHRVKAMGKAKWKLALIMSSLLVLNACSTIVAENRRGATELTPLELQQTFGVGKDLEVALNRLNNEVVILARSGQDLEKYGIRYSHRVYG